MSYNQYSNSSSNSSSNNASSRMTFIPSQFTEIDLEQIKQNNPYIHHKLTTFKPLKDFLNITRVKLPQDFKDWQKRVVTNLNYFNSNYHALVGLVSLILLFRNWWLLFSLGFLLTGIILLNKYEHKLEETIYFQGQQIQVNKNYIYLGLFCLTLPVILYSSPFSTLLSLVSISASVVLLHASVMDTQGETSFNEYAV
ncbi:hypothetical protein WICPIJ_006193 [Wickerhamomyces pijperi]|uniref:PRA1 family protein n=1 Tax=Wickerhamomyces pijperi TaxID=599730 RepID=A0A9P8Q4S2_WICPI|nr:hypothetical protein WICPIJ_006193 [Wickerhamomyces pijperi]